MNAVIEELKQGVLDGDREGVIRAMQEGIFSKISADILLKEGLMPAMAECGRLFEEGEYFVPELLVAARAMQGGLQLLKPLLISEEIKPMGTIVIGTVRGDLHDIGKNLVGMMMEGAGLRVIDLGSDVASEKFVNAVIENNADFVGMSALLTTTMANMVSVIDALQDAGIRDKVKVFVGGAPVNQTFADQIGADGYADDASQAAKLAIRYLESK